MSDEFFELIFV